MMRILITGSNGFVAQKFCEQLKQASFEGHLLGLSKSQNRNPHLHANEFMKIDLNDFDELQSVLLEFNPTHILHTAAITSVEACEQNTAEACKVNIELTLLLGRYVQQQHCHMTFLSTDFVFDGQHGPYDEHAPTIPVNTYGQTKVEAEQQLLSLNSSIAILRTILVYGAIADPGRTNLVLWAKTQLEQNKDIKVVRDQWRMPTWVDDLSRACMLAMQQQALGIFHISGCEMMSIEEAVLQIADYWNFDRKLITSISAKEIGQDSNRPVRTGFILDKAATVLGYNPTPFIVSLQEIDKQIKSYTN